jgi:hypothetical protein
MEIKKGVFMNRVLLILLLLNLMALSGQSEFDEWLKSQEEEYGNWKSQQDKKFSEFLEHGWSHYKTSEHPPRDIVPKPDDIPNPVDHQYPDLMIGNPIDIDTADMIDKPPSTAKILEDIHREQLLYAVSKGSETIRLSFWGLVFNLNYNLNMKIEEILKCDEQNIAAFWGQISNTDYELIYKDLQKMRTKFALNDWAFCQLIFHTGEEIYHSNKMANLFTWFILTKSGFDCKVGYNEDSIYLLLATKNRIYGEPHLIIDGRDYFSIDLSRNKIKPLSIYTYAGNYPEANDLVDLNLFSSPYFNEVILHKQLSFTYDDSTYIIPVEINQTLVEFLADYPATDLSIYFNSSISPGLHQSLINGITPIINNKTQAEALNILLRFVQTAFQYQTDEQQFGEENSLFPEETIYYDYCDCEDRAFLFSYLVREFLNLNVIGLDYPGHIATAVQTDFDIAGNKVAYNGRDYLVCDPTYINADIGFVMPQFLEVEPVIIQFR